jgi:hypothetical protein
MTEDRTLTDLVVTEGRAYRRGDVILLRFKGGGRVTPETSAHFADLASDFADRTGVHFVLLDDAFEVVEPAARGGQPT